VVTGGGRGIGAGIARRLSADGHAVAVVDVLTEEAERTASALRDAGGRAVAVTADISDEDAVEAAIEEVSTSLGAATILVNNAGITRDNLLFKMTAAEWDEVMGVHLRGAFLMTRGVQPSMVEAQWGRVVSMSSIGAYGNRGQANYSAAKAGLQGFAKTVAIELGPYGVTSNCVAPGFIESDMTRATAERIRMPFDEFRKRGAAATAVRRVGMPDDIAAVVSFLVSEGASYLTGQVVNVCGAP
jgi:3-oxoacyl-[acyl-carrier protein] reductase